MYTVSQQTLFGRGGRCLLQFAVNLLMTLHTEIYQNRSNVTAEDTTNTFSLTFTRDSIYSYGAQPIENLCFYWATVYSLVSKIAAPKAKDILEAGITATKSLYYAAIPIVGASHIYTLYPSVCLVQEKFKNGKRK